MTTTSEYQIIPDFYSSQQECNSAKSNTDATNPRYLYFNQTHFTAGDEEQFEYYKNYTTDFNDKTIPNESNIFKDKIVFDEWAKYKDVDAIAVINTFRYIFYKFKKGIFVKIVNNKLAVFLPFSNVCYKNEWSKQIEIDPKFKDLYSFLEYVSKMGGYKYFNSASVNTDIEQWYGNNCIIRYDMTKGKNNKYYPSEGESNITAIKNMLEVLCENRDIPDIEFFINKRDFPILTVDATEPYNNIWNSYEKPLLSHNYDKYIPILSMCTSKRYADISIPTYEDWSRVQQPHNVWFPDSCSDYNVKFNKVWNTKKPTAVFRGKSTGCGVTIETNIRLKLAYLSQTTKADGGVEKYLDAGITKWNLRPRKIQGEKYLKTIDIEKTGIKLVSFLSPLEQSNYKYIINVDGHVSAFRLSLEMNMGCVILMVESPWTIWFKPMLIPYVHYVPVKSDLSNLIQQIKWCRDNDKKCQEIVKNTQLFFDTYLQRNGIMDYMQLLFTKMKKDMGTYLYTKETPLDAQIRLEFDSFKYDYPITDKMVQDISEIPSIPRCYGKLKGVHWIVNMILTTNNFEKIATIDGTYNFKNKLSNITKWSINTFNFIVKSTMDSQKKKENIHEVYVGINRINELCKQVPNFAYIFGYYETPDNRSNVIVEYIPGQTLFEYIQSNSFVFEDYLLIIIQICLALEVAQKNCALVHYDVTPWNIILHKISDVPVNIDYILSDKRMFRVKTNVIPVIIDYGKSYVINQHEHHGFVNMFQFNSIQDVLTLLIKSIDQIITVKKLQPLDFKSLIFLANFMSKTGYRKEPINNSQELRNFVKKTGKYACLISDDKHELSRRTPLDLVKHIHKLKNHYSTISTSFGNPSGELSIFMNISNPRQVFDYILASSQQEKLNTYINVCARIKSCTIPISKNLFMNYYAAQVIENNILYAKNDMIAFLAKYRIRDQRYLKIFEDTLNFIESVYSEKFRSKNVHYNIDEMYNELVTCPYKAETFLNREIIYEYLDKYRNIHDFDDINDYKDIVESVLVNTNTYKLSTEDKIYYSEWFSSLTNADSIALLVNSANIKTARILAQILYKTE